MRPEFEILKPMQCVSYIVVHVRFSFLRGSAIESQEESSEFRHQLLIWQLLRHVNDPTQNYLFRSWRSRFPCSKFLQRQFWNFVLGKRVQVGSEHLQCILWVKLIVWNKKLLYVNMSDGGFESSIIGFWFQRASTLFPVWRTKFLLPVIIRKWNI